MIVSDAWKRPRKREKIFFHAHAAYLDHLQVQYLCMGDPFFSPLSQHHLFLEHLPPFFSASSVSPQTLAWRRNRRSRVWMKRRWRRRSQRSSNDALSLTTDLVANVFFFFFFAEVSFCFLLPLMKLFDFTYIPSPRNFIADCLRLLSRRCRRCADGSLRRQD